MQNHCDAVSETARGSASHQWGLTHPNLGLCAFRQSTWCAGCPGGSVQPWPRPAGHARYSVLMYGCPRR